MPGWKHNDELWIPVRSKSSRACNPRCRAGVSGFLIRDRTHNPETPARHRQRQFDIPGGFHLRVPIADYYSTKSGRLEGAGVVPDIPVKAEEALEAALEL